MSIAFPTPVAAARIAEGLDPAIDRVAARAPAGHRFLTRGWYAAAVEVYGGRARTVVVGDAVALPFVNVGPRWLGLASVPGIYWPFRDLVAATDAGAGPYRAALDALGTRVRALRLGPVADGDAVAAPLLAAARDAGWAVIDRFVAGTFVLDMAEPGWPRSSTLKKNRFHEKHLAAHGALDWRFLHGEDWPAGFEALAAVEAQSWQAGADDAKFAGDHGRFWRAAARDPVVAGMMRAALLRVDGAPAAFSFDLECADENGGMIHAVANSYAPAIAKHSPGKLLQYRNLVAARARGVVRVDWGAGDSGYKRTIGATEGADLRDWLLLAPGPAAAAGRVLARWWRRSGN